jgi:hypothetical protein
MSDATNEDAVEIAVTAADLDAGVSTGGATLAWVDPLPDPSPDPRDTPPLDSQQVSARTAGT